MDSSACLILQERYGAIPMCLRRMNLWAKKKFLRLAGIDLRQIDDIPRLYIFSGQAGDVDDYGPEDVTNCSFGRHLEARGDARTYDIVRGGQAFYHKIVTDLREWNISADMWEGFKLETVTELPK